MALLLVDIALVLLLVRVMGALMARIGQPRVLAEILGGVVLGPSVLGAVAPSASASLFPADVVQALSGIGEVGLTLFVFLVGLELDLATVRRQGRKVRWVSAGALLLPFGFGLLIAIPLYGGGGTGAAGVGEVPFMIFIATAVTLTALPVLARILADHGISATRMGTLALSSAVVLDLAGWLLLAISLAALGRGGFGGFVAMALAALAFVVVLVWVVRPLLSKALERMGSRDARGYGGILLVVALIMMSAGVTDAIGLHAIFGAFLLGLVFPRDRVEVMRGLREAVWPLTMTVLLPIYFVGPGLDLNIAALGLGDLPQLAAIMAVACLGKIGGSMGGARLAGMKWLDACAIGVLLNTRGLVELIALNIGFSAGVLSETLYSELVVMALLTTMMTGPLIQRLGLGIDNRASRYHPGESRPKGGAGVKGDEFVEPLREFISKNHLEEEGELSADTPLLEWAVLDSFTLVELLEHIRDRFGIDVPNAEVTPQNFSSLAAIGALLERLQADASFRPDVRP